MNYWHIWQTILQKCERSFSEGIKPKTIWISTVPVFLQPTQKATHVNSTCSLEYFSVVYFKSWYKRLFHKELYNIEWGYHGRVQVKVAPVIVLGKKGYGGGSPVLSSPLFPCSIMTMIYSLNKRKRKKPKMPFKGFQFMVLHSFLNPA